MGVFFTRKILIIILFFLLLPICTQAVGVGFVPSTGIWFSRSSFAPHETVRVYSVVINNDFSSLDGQVGFYDNSELIDSVEFKGLSKETAKQIRIFWEPTEGEHTISAKFIKAVAIDEKGGHQELNVGQINGFTGAPLTVGNSVVIPYIPVEMAQIPVNSVASSTASLGATVVNVKKDGDKLVLAVPNIKSDSKPANTVVDIVSEAQDIFQKNREILTKAEKIASTITSTAGKVEQAYNQTKSTIDQGKAYYDQGKEYWRKASPYLERAKPFWDKISNNNEPKRVVIIVVVILILAWFIKWRIRRRLYRRYED